MSIWLHGFLFYNIGYIPLLLFIFMLKLFQIWPIGASSRWLFYVLLLCLHYSLSHSLPSLVGRCFRLICLPMPRSGIRHLPRSSASFKWKTVSKNQTLEASSHCYWDGVAFQYKELGNMCMEDIHTHTHTHIGLYTNIFAYTHACVYICTHTSINVSMSIKVYLF